MKFLAKAAVERSAVWAFRFSRTPGGEHRAALRSHELPHAIDPAGRPGSWRRTTPGGPGRGDDSSQRNGTEITYRTQASPSTALLTRPNCLIEGVRPQGCARRPSVGLVARSGDLATARGRGWRARWARPVRDDRAEDLSTSLKTKRRPRPRRHRSRGRAAASGAGRGHAIPGGGCRSRAGPAPPTPRAPGPSSP